MGGLEPAWEELVGADQRAISGYNVGAPLIQLDRIDHSRIDTFGQVLAELARRPSIAGISLGELAERCHEWPGDGAPFDPIAGYDLGTRSPVDRDGHSPRRGVAISLPLESAEAT